MENLLLPIFLVISGLSLAGVALPQVVRVIGGVCGLIAGVLMIL